MSPPSSFSSFLLDLPFCEWSFSPAIGNSGGILSIWCSSKGKTVFSFFGTGYVGICFEWGVNKTRCYLVNVYAKCALRDKRLMWEKLIQLKHFFCGDVWCVVGDFNSVLHTFERLRISATNRSGENIEIREFGDFDSLMGLIDLPLLGRRFTWFKPNGNAASRLDRFLVSDGWWERWAVASQWALPRDVSDHCPIVLRYSSQLWGPMQNLLDLIIFGLNIAV
jgi:hypothetical protein